MTDYASFLTDNWLAPLGFSPGPPQDSAPRDPLTNIFHRIKRVMEEKRYEKYTNENLP